MSATIEATCACGEKLLVAREAAELLRLPVKSLYDMCNRNEVPCIRIGRRVRFDLHELRAWLLASRGDVRAPLNENSVAK
jgi:excisionase family DNA binding protein